MKKFQLFILAILSVSQVSAGIFEAGGYTFFGDSQYRPVWDFAAKRCKDQGMVVAAYEVVNALKDDVDFKDGVTGIGFHNEYFWTSRKGYPQAVHLLRKPIAFPLVNESSIRVLCMSGSAPVPPTPPTPPAPPVPNPHTDPCARYTQHGVSACMNNSRCDWSSDSRSCYSKTGFECGYYTQHGVSACMNNTTSANFRCEWSVTPRQCFQKTGFPCAYYTQFGVTACMQSSPSCDWSTTSRKCYVK